MKADIAAQIGVRVLAIWLLVSAVSGLSGLAGFDTTVVGYQGAVAVGLGAVATQVAAALFLWNAASWVARRIAYGAWESDIALGSWSPALVAQVCVGVLGVAMLSTAIPESVWYVVALTASRLAGPSPLAGQPAYEAQMGLYTIGGIANAAAVLIRLALGAFLFIRARMVSTIIVRGDAPEVARSRPTKG